ncbi:MAG: ELM1/GtrOC1 family putative glycosyltransferase, partial [Thiohalobacterales bacterium]|nr:ELM1/GtrOC1 family putative glycosyltransferase [Thiohalobacterales bacterium]
MAAQHPDPVVVWCFTDGKAGHANQVQGLLAALRGILPVDAHTLQVADIRMPLWSLVSGRFAAGRDMPDPDLLLGAGRATHLPMLAARRARGGRAVVLMKPGLPLSWF